MPCLRPPFRMTQSTSLNARGGAMRNSSVHRIVPWRIKISVCENSQSAPSALLLALPERSRPATRIWPCAVRRISSSGASTNSCSKPRFQSEPGDRVPTTRGRRSASRPSRSNSVTLLISKVGNKPSERAETLSMRTGTPTRRVACCSSSGRHSLIRGTINPCSPPQAMAKSNHRASSGHSSQRDSVALTLSQRGGWGESFMR